MLFERFANLVCYLGDLLFVVLFERFANMLCYLKGLLMCCVI